MKAHPRADYPIRVIPYWSDSDRCSDAGFDGVFEVLANCDVRVVFAPDIVRVLETGISRGHWVTAGDRDVVSRQASGGNIHVVSLAEFARFVGEMTEIYNAGSPSRYGVPVESLGSYAVIRFLRSTVLTPMTLDPYERYILGFAEKL